MKDRQQHIADPERWRQLTLATTPRRVREVARYTYLETGSMEDSMDDFAARAATDSARQVVSGSVYMPAPELIIAGSRVAVRRALAIQRALGVSAVAMRDGKMVIIPPEELPIDINDVDWDTRERALPTEAAGEPT